MSKKAEKEALAKDAIEGLKRLGLKPGTRIYTMITHVGRSGMSRHVRVFMVVPYKVSGKKTEPTIVDITGYVANACGLRRANGSRWDIVVGGCGFDAGFHVVYSLGRALFPKGGPVKKSERRWQEEKAGKTREENGGYLLKHERM